MQWLNHHVRAATPTTGHHPPQLADPCVYGRPACCLICSATPCPPIFVQGFHSNTVPAECADLVLRKKDAITKYTGPARVFRCGAAQLA